MWQSGEGTFGVIECRFNSQFMQQPFSPFPCRLRVAAGSNSSLGSSLFAPSPETWMAD